MESRESLVAELRSAVEALRKTASSLNDMIPEENECRGCRQLRRQLEIVTREKEELESRQVSTVISEAMQVRIDRTIMEEKQKAERAERERDQFKEKLKSLTNSFKAKLEENETETALLRTDMRSAVEDAHRLNRKRVDALEKENAHLQATILSKCDEIMALKAQLTEYTENFWRSERRAESKATEPNVVIELYTPRSGPGPGNYRKRVRTGRDETDTTAITEYAEGNVDQAASCRDADNQFSFRESSPSCRDRNSPLLSPVMSYVASGNTELHNPTVSDLRRLMAELRTSDSSDEFDQIRKSDDQWNK